MSKTARSTWKKGEQRGAEFFGCNRVPGSGGWKRKTEKHETSSDSTHPFLYLERKLRPVHTAVTLWRDTKEKADKENKVPVVCLQEKGKHGAWLLVHSSDLDKIIKYRNEVLEKKVKEEKDGKS